MNTLYLSSAVQKSFSSTASARTGNFPAISHQSAVFCADCMFTIEPMINEGSPDFFVDEDNDWTIYTIDDGLSAQIEYMVLVKEDGIEILTK